MTCPNCGHKTPTRSATGWFLWAALSAFILNELAQFNYWLLAVLR